MDLVKYKIFKVAAETGNLTQTATLCYYTQSGISHMLNRLEDELGFPLFYRDRRGVHLTENGQQILPTINNLLMLNENLEQLISDIKGVQKGTLTIGSFASISIHWLPPLLEKYQKDFPNIDIHLKEGGISDIENWIADHDVDFAFCSRQPHQKAEWIPLKKDALMAVLPLDYPIPPGVTTFPLKDFAGKPFIMSEMGTDYDIHRVFEETDIKLDIRLSCQDDYAIISMVRNHLGITILPELILEDYKEQIKALPLEPEYFRHLGIGMLSGENLSPAAAKFIQYAKATLPQIV